jgi:hypothetical protein
MRRTPDIARFNGMALPSTDFEAVRDDLRVAYSFYELDLSTARSIAAGTQLTMPFKGNVFYVDQNSDVGNATVIFHDAAVLTVKPGRVFVQNGFNAGLPFDQLTFENTAQAGKVLRFFYGVDIDFKPGVTGLVQLSGNVSVVPALDSQGASLDRGYIYGASYTSITNKLANTPDTIFAPGSNVNGAIVWDAEYFSQAGGVAFASILAKSSAPASAIDGDVILIMPSNTGIQTNRRVRAVRIAAGKGLYRISSANESGAQCAVLYTLL